MPNSSARRPVTIRHKVPETIPHSTARMPDGTWLLHYMYTGYLYEIACVRNGRGRGVYNTTARWGNPSFWHVAVFPGARLHGVVAAFVAATQLGVVDRTLLGKLERGPWL